MRPNLLLDPTRTWPTFRSYRAVRPATTDRGKSGQFRCRRLSSIYEESGDTGLDSRIMTDWCDEISAEQRPAVHRGALCAAPRRAMSTQRARATAAAEQQGDLPGGSVAHFQRADEPGDARALRATVADMSNSAS